MWKVIIADDEKLICRLIEALVDWEKLNMRIAGKAENGLEALQMVRELRPHLLITDIRMPGCDGLDLIRQARELSPDIEIVIISGCAHFEYAQTAIAYGVGNYILKPVNQAELNKTLQKILLRLEEKSEGGASRGGGQTGPQRLREYLIRDLLDGRREFTEEELAQNYQFHVQGRCVQAFLLKLDLDGGELGESVATARLAADERLIEGRGRLLEEAPAAADIPRQALLNRYTNLVYHGIEILDGEPLRLSRESLRAGVLAVPRIRGQDILELVLDAGRIFALRAGAGDMDAFQARCGQRGRARAFPSTSQRCA